MRFTKPAWVAHYDTHDTRKEKRVSILSVSVHPDGSRIATGAVDKKIRIWATAPILDPAAEARGAPKNLCTLSMHTGAVMTVRWSFSGKWLASGSDDTIVMIWDLDPNGGGKIWGSDESNLEGWKPLKRLPGHDSDVTDLAWAPGDRYLASVGLDAKTIIWCGYSLQKIRILGVHEGFVKGVCWDPVGEFLATASDDKSVRVWRTTDWKLEAAIHKPFEDSGGSTFFLRLSWSPDGAHITASNATNNSGMVFVAAVISRHTWTSEISLVGHENTLEVACYNPHIFLRNPSQPVITSNICSVVALGADDHSVSIWQTKSARPLIVAKEAFERIVLDLSWSSNGLTLYACSSDGTLAVFDFDVVEMEGIADKTTQDKYLQKFGFVPPPPGPHHQQQQQQPPPPPPPSSDTSLLPPDDPISTFQPPAIITQPQPEPTPQKVTIGKNGKRRIQPSFLGQLSTSGSFPGNAPGGNFAEISASVAPFGSNSTTVNGTPSTSASAFIKVLPSGMTSVLSNGHLQPPPIPPTVPQVFTNLLDDVDTFMAPPSLGTWDTLNTTPSRKHAKNNDFLLDGKGKARTLGGDRVREDGIVVKELRMSLDEYEDMASTSVDRGRSIRLEVPKLKTYISVKTEGNDDLLLEGRNAEEPSKPAEVNFVLGKQTQWLDFLPSRISSLALTNIFAAVAMEDGSVNVYSHTGRRMIPTMSLGSPCSFFEGSKSYLMAITTSGQLTVWNIKTQRAVLSPLSVLPLLSQPNTKIVSAQVRPNGAPLLHLSSGVAQAYDVSLRAWVKVCETWWSEGSDVWEGRQRSAANKSASNRGILVGLESTVAEQFEDSMSTSGQMESISQKPQWWSAALTLGHLETRLHAAKVLETPAVEYKHALLLYAKRIAEEAFRGKAEELLKELCGPVYLRASRDETWNPTILGMSKRDLLKDVLSIFARSKTLTKLAMDWQELLKKAAAEEY